MQAPPSGIEAYQLGREYTVMPIPIVPEHCVEVPAGPVTFIVEARSLTVDAIVENEQRQDTSDGLGHDYVVDAGGASLHVVDAETRTEYLRFDAFDHEPHYHYIYVERQVNVVVRVDDVAEGDPLAWTIRVVGNRLPEMLAHADAAELAEAVRAVPDQIAAAVGELERVLRDAEMNAASLRPASRPRTVCSSSTVRSSSKGRP